MRRNLLMLTITLVFLAGAMALFQFTDLDIQVQDHCYDFVNHTWRIQKDDTLLRIVLYTGPKVVIAVVAGIAIVALLVPKAWRPKPWRAWDFPWPKDRVWLCLICLAIIPITVGLMKRRSDLYCPWSVDRYGGDRPHLHFFDPLPANYPEDCGRCFPAGHASGGFALLGLMLLSDTRRARWLGLTIGLTAGWLMGGYQMLKGAHFLSHTVVTMLIAFAFTYALGLLLPRQREPHRDLNP